MNNRLTTLRATSGRDGHGLKTMRRVTAALTALGIALAAGCSVGAHPKTTTTSGATSPRASQPGASTGASGLYWIISGATLTRLRAADPAGRTTRQYFDTPNAYVLVAKRAWAVPAGWTSTPTADFTSFTALRAALAANSLDPRIRAVLYDNEHWSLTPAAEQADPVHYDELAAGLVHRHHLRFLAAPATDLVNGLSQSTADGRFAAFLRLNLAADIAPYTDVLDLQAQGAEADPSLFASFVAAAAAQARRADPGVKILVGISTNPSGAAVTAAAIDRAVRSVRGDVDGFWLNDPATSAACPMCAGPYPALALAAVRGM